MSDGSTPHVPVMFSIGPPGEAATGVGPGRPPSVFGTADHELNEASIDGLEIRAASSRGLWHRYFGTPRQDSCSIYYDRPTRTLLACVADGVGSMPMSQEAARLATSWAPFYYLRHRCWPQTIHDLNRHLSEYSQGRIAISVPRVDDDATAMATTFAGLALTCGDGPRTASVVWTDDSTVWSLEDGTWTELTRNSTADDQAVYTPGVRGLPHETPRFYEAVVPAERGALFVMSDGVGVPLAGSRQVREALASWWVHPPDVFTFAGQVGFARQAHMDDRTAVGIWLDGADDAG